MINFEETQSIFNHHEGKLVKYDDKAIVVGGRFTAEVEEMDSAQAPWTVHPMSPVNGYPGGDWGNPLFAFTALSISNSLFIFGQSRLTK